MSLVGADFFIFHAQQIDTRGGRLMSVVWLIAKFALYTVILKVLFAQTFNFIFMLAKRPSVWIGLVALLGVANMALAYALSWDPRLVSFASLTAVILSIPKRLLSKSELRAAADEAYQEWGIAHWRLKYRLGLIAFLVSSLAAYVLLFSEICTSSGECVPMITGVFSRG
jgi:hypothetical protein